MTYDLTPVSVECPICARTEAELLWTVESESLMQSKSLADRDPDRSEALQRHIESLWGQNTCRMVRCKHCLFEFADPFVAGDALFYELFYAGFPYTGRRWEWGVTADRVRSLIDEGEKDASLLEVGAGSGGFLKLIVPSVLGPDAVMCTEYAPDAQKKLEKQGLSWLARDFREMDEPSFEGRFSFICMFHVLEHLDQLDQAFEALNFMTKPGGRLFISLPNPKSAEFYESRGVWIEWPPHHTGRWRRRTFEVMGERFGWRVVDHRIEPVGVPAFLKELAARHVLERSKVPGSLSRRIRHIGSRPIRHAAFAPVLALELLRSIPAIPRLRSGELGRSHWVEMLRGE